MSDLHGRTRSHRLPSLLLAATLLASRPAAWAADPPLQIAQYAHTSWTARDGALLGLVFAMAQTPDGYLWIAGSFGLFRFDGLRFTPWHPPDGQSLPSGPYSLLVSRDGTLWIGTYSGLSSWNGKEFTRRHPEIGKAFVTSLLEDREGTVWAGVRGESGRLCAIRAGQIRCIESGFGSMVWSLSEDRTGSLWAGAESGLWRWSPGTPRQYLMHGLPVGDLTTTVDGQVLVGLRGGGLRQVAGDRLVPHGIRRADRPDQWLADSDIKGNKLLRDRDGGLWIGTEGRGLLHVKDGQADTFTRAEGLSGNIACSLFEDREGNVWYGSERGLDRFRKLPVTTLSTRQGLPDDVVKSVVSTRDGSVWVATNDGLARWNDGRLVVYKDRDGLPSSQVHSQYEDSDGRLWVSTRGGLAYFANDRFVAIDAGPSTEIRAMAGDAAGNLWLAGDKGLARLWRGRFVENVPWAAFGQRQQAQVIVVDRGGLWLSFWDDGGVSYFKDGKVEATYRFGNRQGQSYVTSLRLDADGAQWAATLSGGLHRIKEGRVTTLSLDNGLPCDTVHWSTLDDKGSMWMYTACGLVRVARDELAAWVADPARRVAMQVWGATDGVPLMVTPQSTFNPAVASTLDGKLWFVTGAELQVIDPDHMPSNPVPPPVHITALAADQKSYAVDPGLRLPPLARDITIEFAALTLADPKSTRFRYRLEGHDNDWQEAVDRRLATYSNLPPGNYRFQVKASNNSGVWNDEGAQLEFSIEPAFYQTTWFRLAGAVVLVGLAWGAFQLRLRMQIRRLHRQFEATLEGRVAERTRIARDLHDTLLQHFHGLLLQFQAGVNLLPDRPRESRQILVGAIDRAAEAITEGRDTVHGLRTWAPQTNGLAEPLRALAEQLANENEGSPSAQVQEHGTPRSLHPLVHDETLRIAGEALRNAFRHADAKQVRVEIHFEPRAFLVRVRDDGQGIPPEVMRKGRKEGHFGLTGMRERAKLVSGRLVVRSSADSGTEVELSVPASRAYGRSSPARSWPWKKLAPSETGHP